MGNNNQENNKRIAKNTLMLYFRMLLTIIITLYTSRVVLEQLGENDFGIYNVVGGIVTMFTILSASLSSAISRFLTFELGKGFSDKLKIIFSTSVIIQLAISLIIVLLIEIGGVWFLNCKMNISPNRLYAANWVLQCSIVTFVINMLSIPYNAAIIAHEKMQAFAYISLLEVTLKLGVAFALFIPLFDSLIAYSILLVVASLIVRLSYGLYCKHNFSECKVEWKFNKGLLKQMMAYSGWNFIGSSSAILRDQGVNIVMNLFCGTAVNAARGIAVQVNSAVNGFSQNFMLAVNPQIIKSYASGELKYMFHLGFRSSRFGYYLLFCISSPLIIEMPYILHLWLTVVPDYTVSFAQLILIFGMSESLSIPLQYMNQATGRIKIYQLVVGGIQILNFPIAYVLLKGNLSPDSVFILSIVISQICLFARLIILRKTIHLSIKEFIIKVYLKVIMVTFVGWSLPLIVIISPLSLYFNPILNCSFTFLYVCVIAFIIGCNKEEKSFLINKVKSVISKIR